MWHGGSRGCNTGDYGNETLVEELGWTSLSNLVGLVGMVVDVSMRSLAVGSLYDYIHGSDLSCDVMVSQGSKIKFSYFWIIQDE